MYSLSIRFKNLDAVERIRVPFGAKSLTIFSNNKQYIQPANGLKSLSIEFAIGGGAYKMLHYRRCNIGVAITYGLLSRIIKNGSTLIFNISISNSDGTNSYDKDVVLNYSVSWIAGDTPGFINNQTLKLTAGQSNFSLPVDVGDATRASLTINSVTPGAFDYSRLTEQFFA